MRDHYISKVQAQTPTRLWINNPTGAELAWALAAGAVSGTTNPSYCANLLDREPQYIGAIIDEVVPRIEDNDEAADVVYQKLTARFMDKFLPLYQRSGGSQGFVTMQDDPRRDRDARAIVAAAERHRLVGVNYMAKVPVTEAGMEAMNELVERNIPICATECFALAQAIAMYEVYEHAARSSGNRPPFFLTHITGIYDEELGDYVTRHHVDLPPGWLHLAGCLVARKQYHTLKKMGCRVTMLGGGARGPHHFSEFVGGDMHITLNWNTVQELIDRDEPVTMRIHDEAPREMSEELCARLPDFRRAWEADGLQKHEFEHFAPLQRFRNKFLDGVNRLLAEIGSRRD